MASEMMGLRSLKSRCFSFEWPWVSFVNLPFLCNNKTLRPAVADLEFTDALTQDPVNHNSYTNSLLIEIGITISRS